MNLDNISIPFSKFDFPKKIMIRDTLETLYAFDNRFNYREFDGHTITNVIDFFNEKTGLRNMNVVEHFSASPDYTGDINILLRYYSENLNFKYIGLEYTSFELTIISLLSDKTTRIKDWYR